MPSAGSLVDAPGRRGSRIWLVPSSGSSGGRRHARRTQPSRKSLYTAYAHSQITEQIPDERIAWRSVGGVANAGVVTFHHLADHRTRIMLQLEYDPEGVTEKVGDAVGVVSRRVAGDLERFKEFIESRGRETGAWRGEVKRP